MAELISTTLIRPFEARDRQTVRAIACDSADMGKPIESIFPDREVAADLLVGYYTDYDPSSTWVAQQGETIVGYVNGCFDNRRYGLAMFWIIVPCVLAKAFKRGTLFKKEIQALISGMLRNWRRLFCWRKESFNSHQAHLHIGIAAAVRGQGVGERLVQALLEGAKARGVSEITASVHSGNTSACVFFERLGFKIEGRYPMVMARGQSLELYHSLLYVKKII